MSSCKGKNLKLMRLNVHTVICSRVFHARFIGFSAKTDLDFRKGRSKKRCSIRYGTW